MLFSEGNLSSGIGGVVFVGKSFHTPAWLHLQLVALQVAMERI